MIRQDYLEITASFFALFLVLLGVNLEVTELRSLGVLDAQRSVFATALLFSSYVLGLLITLLMLGGVADRFGAKRIIVLSLCLSLISLSMLLVERNELWVGASRLVRGVSVALMLSATSLLTCQILGKGGKSGSVHGAICTLGLGGGGVFTLLVFASFEVEGVEASASCLMALQLLALGVFVSFSRGRAAGGVGGAYVKFNNNAFWAYLVIFLAWSQVGVVVSVIAGGMAGEFGRGGSSFAIFFSVGLGGLLQPVIRCFERGGEVELGLAIGLIAILFLIVGSNISDGSLLVFAAILCGASSQGYLYFSAQKRVMLGVLRGHSAHMSGFFLAGYLGLGLPSIVVGFLSDNLGLQYALQIYGVYFIVVSGVILMLKREDLFVAQNV